MKKKTQNVEIKKQNKSKQKPVDKHANEDDDDEDISILIFFFFFLLDIVPHGFKFEVSLEWWFVKGSFKAESIKPKPRDFDS